MNSQPEDREYKKALSYAYAALARRALSVNELREKLKRKKVPASLREKVLNYLVERGFLNDSEYAVRFTGERHRSGHGKIKIKFELKRRGISGNIIEDALESLSDESQEQKAYALALRKKELGKDYGQVMRFLLSRGFSPGISRRVLAAVFTKDDNDFSSGGIT